MKTLYISLILLCITYKSFATKDSLDTDTTKTTVTLATLYSSNANYYGQTSEAKLPYALGNATLRFKSGFSVSASGYKLLNSGSGISGVDLGLGYDFKIADKILSGLSYTHSFYPTNSSFIQASNDSTTSSIGTFSGSLGLDWNWFKTAISSSYAIGEQQDVFINFSNSKLIDLGSLFSENDYLSLEPSFGIVAGTKHAIKTSQANRQIKTQNQINQLNNQLINLGNNILNPGKQRKEEVQKEIVKMAKTKEDQDKNEVKTTEFDLLTYNFSLPIAFNRNSYIIEASYEVSVLGKNVTESIKKPQSFFNLGFYYMF